MSEQEKADIAENYKSPCFKVGGGGGGEGRGSGRWGEGGAMFQGEGEGEGGAGGGGGRGAHRGPLAMHEVLPYTNHVRGGAGAAGTPAAVHAA